MGAQGPLLRVQPPPSCVSTLCTHTHPQQDPNPEDPLNKEAAELLLQNRNQFEQTIQRHILRGQHIGNTYWPPCAS